MRRSSCLSFFFSAYGRPRVLHSFPTRRSSDLSHFVHGRDSLVDILKERGLLSESDAVQPLIGKKSSDSDSNRSEERFSRNAETDLVCRLLLEKKKNKNNKQINKQRLTDGNSTKNQ